MNMSVLTLGVQPWEDAIKTYGKDGAFNDNLYQLGIAIKSVGLKDKPNEEEAAESVCSIGCAIMQSQAENKGDLLENLLKTVDRMNSVVAENVTTMLREKGIEVPQFNKPLASGPTPQSWQI